MTEIQSKHNRFLRRHRQRLDAAVITSDLELNLSNRSSKSAGLT
jgi:hypothetical protein